MSTTGLGVFPLFGKVRAPLVSEPVNFRVRSDILRCQATIFKKRFKTFINSLTGQFDVRRNLIRRQYRIGRIVKNLQYLTVGNTSGTTAGHSGFGVHGPINSHYSDISGHVANRVVNIIMVATNKGGKTADRPGTEGVESNGPEGTEAVVPSMMYPNDRARKYEAGAQRTAEISDEQLPEEGAHKDQLQSVVARHPIAPDVREANE